MDKVTCPYCGAEMGPVSDTDEFSFQPMAYWHCENCLSVSPVIMIEDDMDISVADEKALSAALQRYVTPLKPMTLEEVTGSNEPCVFLETKGKEPIWACDCVISSNLNGVNIFFIGDRGCTLVAIYDYCNTWRCWSSRPTDEERQSVAWEESQ